MKNQRKEKKMLNQKAVVLPLDQIPLDPQHQQQVFLMVLLKMTQMQQWTRKKFQIHHPIQNKKVPVIL